MTGEARFSAYPGRRTAIEGWAGSLPAAWALEIGPLSLAMICAGAAGLALAGVPLPPGVVAVAWSGLGVWLLAVAGQAVCFGICRRRSRAAGFAVLVVVPENPRILCWLCRRSGLRVHWRPHALAVHVDERWRRPPSLSPQEAASEFGRQYRADYDRLLGELAGHEVLVVSSTFNRHESEWTWCAAEEGWCRAAAAPLFRSAPARHRPRERAAAQRRMFGGVVSRRRVDYPEAWRTRVFDCMTFRLGGCLALPGRAGVRRLAAGGRNGLAARGSIRVPGGVPASFAGAGGTGGGAVPDPAGLDGTCCAILRQVSRYVPGETRASLCPELTRDNVVDAG